MRDPEIGRGGTSDMSQSLSGYWPAQAMLLVEDARYTEAVQLCRERFQEQEPPLSGRVAYGMALYRAGQPEAAAEQFRSILARDPNHLGALKYLGDIAFDAGDEWSAMANYSRVLEIDPLCQGLTSDARRRKSAVTTRTISLVRHGEKTEPQDFRAPRPGMRETAHPPAVLVSETIGDLYMSQGHPRRAAEVYLRLYEADPRARLAEKLARAKDKATERESSHVAETNE